MLEHIMKFCVITAGEILPDFAVLSAALGSAFALDHDTAAIRARHCWGIIATGLEEHAADRLVERCAVLSLKTFKLPADALSARPAIPINKIVFETGRLSWTGGATLTGSSPAGEILALSAAPVRAGTSRMVKTTEGPSGQEKAVRFGIMAVTGLPIGLGKTREVNKEVKGSDLSFYLDIVLKIEKLRLRLNPANFDFSCLKEKKTYSSQVNFRLLCTEISAFAPGALQNTGLRTMLGNKPLSALMYDTIDDLEKETRRLTALAYRP